MLFTKKNRKEKTFIVFTDRKLKKAMEKPTKKYFVCNFQWKWWQIFLSLISNKNGDGLEKKINKNFIDNLTCQRYQQNCQWKFYL